MSTSPLDPAEVGDMLKRIWQTFYVTHQKDIETFVTDSLMPSPITGEKKPLPDGDAIHKFLLTLVEQDLKAAIDRLENEPVVR